MADTTTRRSTLERKPTKDRMMEIFERSTLWISTQAVMARVGLARESAQRNLRVLRDEGKIESRPCVEEHAGMLEWRRKQ